MRRALLLILVACGGGKTAHPDAARDAAGDAVIDGTGSAGNPLTADQIEKACVAVYSCDFQALGGKTVNDCMTKLSDGDTLASYYRPDQIRCLAAAGSDCTAALACIGMSIGSAGSCSDITACNGSVFHSCQGGRSFDTQCAGGLYFTSDTTCLATGGTHTCGLATCTQTSTTCDGTRLVHCNGSLETVFDCGPYGMTCDGSPSCVGAGAACSAASCQGTSWVRCEGGHEARVDCAAALQGGTCVDATTGCGFAATCADSSPATCNGNVLTACVLGTPMTLDCVAAGYQGCSAGECVSPMP